MFPLHFGMIVGKVVVKPECILSGSRNKFEHSYLRYCLLNRNIFVSK